MILAAGLGTRFRPWTDSHPKALAPVLGKPLLQHAIEYLQRSGIYDVVVNTHHFAGQIADALEANHGWGSSVIISYEPEVLETGGGIVQAAPLLGDESFVLINADILTDLDLREMIAFHERFNPLVTLAVTNRASSRCFLFDHFNDLCGWRNNTTAEERISRTTADTIPKAFSGIHIIDPRIFSLVTFTGKFSLVDLYLDLCRSEIIKAYDHTGSRLIDVGKPGAVEEAERMFSS